MARTKTSEEVREYVHIDTGETAGAYAGTEQDSVFRDDPDWELVTRRTVASAAAAKAAGTAEEATSDGDGGEEGDGGELNADDLKGLGREELNKLAADRGVESPDELPNKGKVIEAILTTTSDGDGGE